MTHLRFPLTSNTHVHTCTHTHTAYMHTCTHVIHVHMRTYTCTHRRTWVQTCTHLHVYTSTCFHMCTCTHMHMNTHAHIGAHTDIFYSLGSNLGISRFVCFDFFSCFVTVSDDLLNSTLTKIRKTIQFVIRLGENSPRVRLAV
jgi:hypothetical protein